MESERGRVESARLKLVGGTRIASDWWSVESLGVLFERLAREVRHNGMVSRCGISVRKDIRFQM